MCDFPWILDAGSKSQIMKYESTLVQQGEIRGDLLRIREGGVFSPFLMFQVLFKEYQKQVHRDALIEDTLNYLLQGNINLSKPLKVKFLGEDGVDEGGVRKEFFQLIVRQIFDVNYGMFIYNEVDI